MLSSPLKPRRILMTTDAVGGVWRYAADLSRGLNGEGIDVVLACLGPAPSDAQAREIAALGRTRLLHLDAPLDWMAEDEAAIAGIPPMLAELAEGEGAELLHLNLPSQACGLGTELPVFVASHSCVVTWWQAMRDEPLPAAWDWQRRCTLQGMLAADRVIVPSRSHAEDVQSAYGPLPHLDVVLNSAAPQRQEPEAAPPFAETPFIFAAARWWDESKNAGLLDAAAAQLKWPLLAAGDCRGANGQSFRFRHARPVGSLPPHEVRQAMQAAEIFVSPSRFEPFGLAALEAASAGTALVLADIPTYRELWEGAAIFADPDDADDLAHALGELAEDGSLRAMLGRAAAERARNYAPERQLKSLFAVYRGSLEHIAAVEASLPSFAE